MTETTPTQQSATSTSDLPKINGYRLLNLIGAGGMSTVYLAEQISLGRKVAIKLMAQHVSANAEAGERFIREARAAAAVNHPNVISIIDVGQAEGQLYMVLELVTGGDAAQHAEHHGGRLPEIRALEILVDCARGLEALHEARLVHRDLKPSNIFLTRDGIAKVGDLGLARSANGADRMTVTGHLIGTPAFMSPEQAGGEKLDIRSDIYSLGATLFALVTGRQPFIANTPIAVAAKAMVDPTPDPRSIYSVVSDLTATLILKAMEKDPALRFQTPAELKEALIALKNHLALTNQPTGKHIANNHPTTNGAPEMPLVLRPASRRKIWLGVFAASGCAALVVAISLLFPLRAVTPSTSTVSSNLPVIQSPATVTTLPASSFESGESSTNFPNRSPKSESAPLLMDSQPQPPTGDEPPLMPWVHKQGNDDYGHFVTLSIRGVLCNFRWLPPGSCLVGSPESEPGHHPYERQCQMSFQKGVWLSDTECTQELWKAVTGSNPSQQDGRLLPVTNVTLKQVIEFTHAITPTLPNHKARLPSRGEWERACRAGSRHAFTNGNSVHSLAGFANLNGEERVWVDPKDVIVGFTDKFPELALVANQRPNRWGYFDMHGNVAEYCLGRWVPLPAACNDPDAIEDPEMQSVMIRGGGFRSNALPTRCAASPYVEAGNSSSDVGFRFLIEDSR